jgi:hypothetical protein
MRSKWMVTAVSLFVAPALVVASAPANAATPEYPKHQGVPGAEGYVSELDAKKTQQQTPCRDQQVPQRIVEEARKGVHEGAGAVPGPS